MAMNFWKNKIFIFLLVIFFLNFISAWEFNGTTKDVNGVALNGTLVNITVWVMGVNGPTFVGANSTTSNLSGWFELNVSENENWMYKPVITYTNTTTNAIDYIGQSLPEFPYREFVNTSDMNFYLRPAGTINITAINITNDRTTFRYQIKDTKLGYSISSEFNNPVSQAVINVPRDRNYSVMIYPNQAIPVSFNWNNFSNANISYTITAGLSTYNISTHTVHKTFNCTDNLIKLTGYVQNTSRNDFTDWNEFKIVPFLLEPGNMVFLGENAGMPYNMSAWDNGQSDSYNLLSGFFNLTLPGPAESATYLLFATARNGSRYYGAYGNITLSYSSSSTETNLTMYPLMSVNWATTNNNLSLNDAVAWSRINISSAKQQFNLINSTGQIISSMNAHIEAKVDYSAYGAREFTFMTSISSGNASFYLPLLNASVKEINIFSQSYAPKRVGTKTAAQILANPNITMSTFSPGDIDGGASQSNIYVALYQSNSTCDLPSPPQACVLANSATMDPDSEDKFNPMSSIIGGGKISFRMGLLSSGIIVQYVNVDMLASGPPDALFDDSATTSTSGDFDSAMRFGSNGPTIYDFVLISMPYTEGTTTTTGLSENGNVNVSIPNFYDENWNLIWNASANGTSVTNFAGNQSHYSTYSSQWAILMNQTNCTRNQSQLNSTIPCYVDTALDRIWIRLPHFSGTQPTVNGAVVTATSSPTTQSSSSGGGSAVNSFWTGLTVVVGEKQLQEGYSKEIERKQRFKFSIDKQIHYVGLVGLTDKTAVINVSSTPQQAVLSIGEEKKFDVNSDGIYDLVVKLNNIINDAADINIKIINEKIATETENVSEEENTAVTDSQTSSIGLNLFLIVLVVIIVLIIVFISWIILKKVS